MNQLSIFEHNKNYFNTIRDSGIELSESKRKATIQDNRVFEIISKYKSLTPCQVSELYDKIYSPAPLTSIRRSMTVLTCKGLLIKTDEKRNGKFGKKNYCWKVN
jgi:hypothetical protein